MVHRSLSDVYAERKYCNEGPVRCDDARWFCVQSEVTQGFEDGSCGSSRNAKTKVQPVVPESSGAVLVYAVS